MTGVDVMPISGVTCEQPRVSLVVSPEPSIDARQSTLPLAASFSFSEELAASLPADAINVVNLADLSSVAGGVYIYDPATRTAKLTFASPLPDGNYRAMLDVAGVSDAAGNADTSVSTLGLTGVPFVNVRNGCATGGSALTVAHAMLRAGSADLALVVGFDKHPPGAFNPEPEDWGLGRWYGDAMVVWVEKRSKTFVKEETQILYR